MCSCSQTHPADPASTVVNADGTVTFNYRNDAAQKVQVDVQFAGRHDMVRDSLTGLWSVTLGPADPDMYPYNFVVDGVSIMDDQANQWFPNEGFKGSILDIPGTDGPLVHSVQDVPHGRVDYVSYYSNTIGGYNHALVYTPASYNESDSSYPVFYLISGTTDTEEVYYKVGRMNVIADNLIAQGKAKDMIIVLPYGNPAKISTVQVENIWTDFFSKDLINDLMPYVEANYRTIADAEHRAIGGFSRGGNQALSNGLLNLDKFSYLCSYSSFTMTNLPKVYDNAKETNSKINLFWLGIGKDDFLFKTSHDYLEFLDQKGINHVMEFTEGKFGHTWMNAKYFLSHTLPMLFDKEKATQIMANGIEPMAELKGDEVPFTPGVMARIFPRQVVSPEFGDNGAVTLRIKAEKAKQVMLEGEMLKEPVAMACDSDGVWEVTLEGIAPEIYCYNFNVDGLKVMDPTNMYLAPEIGFKRSILEFPDAPFAINKGIGDQPIQYSPVRILTNGNGDYGMIVPNTQEAIVGTICLLGGRSSQFQAWQQIAHADQILDQMLAAGSCKPCNIYMINGSEPMSDATITLNADDYKTWKDCREALIKALKSL